MRPSTFPEFSRSAQGSAAAAVTAAAPPAESCGRLERGPTMRGMRFLGYTGREFLRIGFAAVVFILFAKWLAPKVNVPALTTTVDKI